MPAQSLVCRMTVAVLVLCSLAPFSVAVEGNYASTYTGVKNVRITKNGNVYKVRWDLDDGTHWIGVGLLNKKGDTFTVASVVSKGSDIEYANGSLHVSVYSVEKEDGKVTRLVSEAARYGDKKTHEETLERKTK